MDRDASLRVLSMFKFLAAGYLDAGGPVCIVLYSKEVFISKGT